MENKQVEAKKVEVKKVKNPVLICEVVKLDEEGKEVGGYAVMGEDTRR